MATIGYAYGIQTFTATSGGTYRITAYGGQGGNATLPSGSEYGGDGAEVSGVFQLVAGETLTIVTGGVGLPS